MAEPGLHDLFWSRFIRSYLRFAPPNSRLEEVASDAGLQEKSLSELQRLADTLNDGVDQAEREYRSVSVTSHTQLMELWSWVKLL